MKHTAIILLVLVFVGASDATAQSPNATQCRSLVNLRASCWRQDNPRRSAEATSASLSLLTEPSHSSQFDRKFLCPRIRP
jgi:hypothetical protein